MKVHRPGKKQNIITIENKVTLVKKLVVIFLPAVALALAFWAIFIVESEGLDLSSDFGYALLGCIYKMLSQGCTECLPDLSYIILCTILGGPFAFLISYVIWQHLKSKIILTDQRIVQKLASGKKIQLYWKEIRKVQIIPAAVGPRLILTSNKGPNLLGDTNRIFCPISLSQKNQLLPRVAANLILKKIDRYNIPVKGNRDLLEGIIKTPHQSQQGPARIGIQNITAPNRLPSRPSSAQKPTPK